MAYCRWGDGDLYIFHHADGYLICMSCSLIGENQYRDFTCKTRTQMLAHIAEHAHAKHNVNLHAIDRLIKEIRGRGNKIDDEL